MQVEFLHFIEESDQLIDITSISNIIDSEAPTAHIAITTYHSDNLTMYMLSGDITALNYYNDNLKS